MSEVFDEAEYERFTRKNYMDNPDEPEEAEQERERRPGRVICPYCNGYDLDMDGDSGGSCTHCFGGYIKP